MQSALKFPDKAAVIHKDQQLSYRHLDEITSRLANALAACNVKCGDRIGICTEKSIQAIISIHGIMKAGAAYVPIDPRAPDDRISYIIRDCGIKTMIVSSKKLKKLLKVLIKENRLKHIIISDDINEVPVVDGVELIPWRQVKLQDTILAVKNKAIETDLAYILYTSGSTGLPKGVMISHLNAFTFLNWVMETFKISPQDKVSNHAPLHFDLSILDIFGAFYGGATLVLVPDNLSTFPLKLAEWIEENKITIWYSVPSILSMMVLYGDLANRSFDALKFVIFAGEVFPTKYLRKLMEMIPHSQFYNLYGPTETNVITYFELEHIPENDDQLIPIGKACTNMDVFAVTDSGDIIEAVGEEGELYARGSCVAQGYWGDAEKTKENFILNPWQKNYSDRTYKTGDIVTLDDQGNFIFRGRKDHMIKSRGYRIELGEIESILFSHPDIKEAAVVAMPDELISHKVKAYIVPRDKAELDLQNLKMFCGEKLPKYMIPEDFEFLNFLPKTSTGKVNKQHLLSKQ
jgi:amino acid adenylation domain-containing protein